MNLLTAEHITKAYSERVLLDDVSLGVQEGEKIGVIGVNGMGKSTLLRILAGAEEPDAGSVIRGRNVKVGYLPQTPVFGEEDTILSAVLSGGAQASPEEFAEESEARAMLTRLGLPEFGKTGPGTFRGTEKAGRSGAGPAESGGFSSAGRANQPSGQRDVRLAGGISEPVPGEPF